MTNFTGQIALDDSALQEERRAELAASRRASRPNRRPAADGAGKTAAGPTLATIVLMILTALGFDGLKAGIQWLMGIIGSSPIPGIQALWFVGAYLSININLYAVLTFYVWAKVREAAFATLGYGFISIRKIAVWFIALIVGSIPIINMIPSLTLAVMINLLLDVLESRRRNAHAKA